jgi:transposase
MGKYVVYAPEQDWLLPPRVDDELGADHLVFFLHRLVERLDLGAFEGAYSAAGRPAYPPQMLLKIWLYAYACGITSSRRVEQRLHEDLGFRFLAGQQKPDFWTLNDFRRRHPRALNDVFTQVIEAARELGMGRLGRVAVDSTRVAANASPDRSDSAKQLRAERAKLRRQVRRWQQRCNEEEADDPGAARAAAGWQRRLNEIPQQLKQLGKIDRERSPRTAPPKRPTRVSRTDPEARYQRRRGGFGMSYTGEIAVSEDHLVLAQRVHQGRSDTRSLVPMTGLIKRQCGAKPVAVVADCGYHSMGQIERVERRGIEVYLPDKLLANELAGGEPVEMSERQRRRMRGLAQRRERMRSPLAREHIRRRKAIVEPVFGVLKQQRGMRQFRRRGLAAAQVEWTLATTAYNLTRMFAQCGPGA